MDLIASLATTYDHAASIIDAVKADQLSNTTPCSAWDAQALIAHTIGVVTNIGKGASGAELLPDVNALALEPNLGAQFRTAASANLSAWKARGLDGEVNIGAGPMPAQAGISINLLDTATHAWDIARATGQKGDLPEELAATVYAICQGFVTDEIRKFAGFDAAISVSDSASATDRLVAFLGRKP